MLYIYIRIKYKLRRLLLLPPNTPACGIRVGVPLHACKSQFLSHILSQVCLREETTSYIFYPWPVWEWHFPNEIYLTTSTPLPFPVVTELLSVMVAYLWMYLRRMTTTKRLREPLPGVYGKPNNRKHTRWRHSLCFGESTSHASDTVISWTMDWGQMALRWRRETVASFVLHQINYYFECGNTGEYFMVDEVFSRYSFREAKSHLCRTSTYTMRFPWR